MILYSNILGNIIHIIGIFSRRVVIPPGLIRSLKSFLCVAGFLCVAAAPEDAAFKESDYQTPKEATEADSVKNIWQFSDNLLVNGDAEQSPGAPDAKAAPMPPQAWRTTSAFTTAQYGATGGLPARTDAGPPIRGASFFSGGEDNPMSSAEQLIDVGARSASIDTGDVQYQLSGYLGGFMAQRDYAVLTATFPDASKHRLLSATIGPVTAAERGGKTSLLLRDVAGLVPAHTRSINVMITATRFEGAYNDGYADNIELRLSE